MDYNNKFKTEFPFLTKLLSNDFFENLNKLGSIKLNFLRKKILNPNLNNEGELENEIMHFLHSNSHPNLVSRFELYCEGVDNELPNIESALSELFIFNSNNSFRDKLNNDNLNGNNESQFEETALEIYCASKLQRNNSLCGLEVPLKNSDRNFDIQCRVLSTDINIEVKHFKDSAASNMAITPDGFKRDLIDFNSLLEWGRKNENDAIEFVKNNFNIITDSNEKIDKNNDRFVDRVINIFREEDVKSRFEWKSNNSLSPVLTNLRKIVLKKSEQLPTNLDAINILILGTPSVTSNVVVEHALFGIPVGNETILNENSVFSLSNKLNLNAVIYIPGQPFRYPPTNGRIYINPNRGLDKEVVKTLCDIFSLKA